jgi:hypothetical protein
MRHNELRGEKKIDRYILDQKKTQVINTEGDSVPKSTK